MTRGWYPVRDRRRGPYDVFCFVYVRDGSNPIQIITSVWCLSCLSLCPLRSTGIHVFVFTLSLTLFYHDTSHVPLFRETIPLKPRLKSFPGTTSVFLLVHTGSGSFLPSSHRHRPASSPHPTPMRCTTPKEFVDSLGSLTLGDFGDLYSLSRVTGIRGKRTWTISGHESFVNEDLFNDQVKTHLDETQGSRRDRRPYCPYLLLVGKRTPRGTITPS